MHGFSDQLVTWQIGLVNACWQLSVGNCPFGSCPRGNCLDTVILTSKWLPNCTFQCFALIFRVWYFGVFAKFGYFQIFRKFGYTFFSIWQHWWHVTPCLFLDIYLCLLPPNVSLFSNFASLRTWGINKRLQATFIDVYVTAQRCKTLILIHPRRNGKRRAREMIDCDNFYFRSN